MNLHKVVFEISTGNVTSIQPSDKVDYWFNGQGEKLDDGLFAVHLAESTTVRELVSIGQQIKVIYS